MEAGVGMHTPVSEHSSIDERVVRDANTVVELVALPQATQDADRLRHCGLVHQNALEASLQCRILLDVLPALNSQLRSVTSLLQQLSEGTAQRRNSRAKWMWTQLIEAERS
jgi:hypothetical protein